MGQRVASVSRRLPARPASDGRVAGWHPSPHHTQPTSAPGAAGWAGLRCPRLRCPRTDCIAGCGTAQVSSLRPRRLGAHEKFADPSASVIRVAQAERLPWCIGCGTAKVSSLSLLERSPTPPPPSLDGHRRWTKAGMALSAYSLHRRKRCPSARETLGVSLGRLKRTKAMDGFVRVKLVKQRALS